MVRRPAGFSDWRWQLFQVQFLSMWTVATPQPYRYLDREYVEAFFRHGTLRLSTFSKFAQHKDELRRDEHEGVTGVVVRANQGEMKTIAARVQMGYDAHILCSSSYFSEDLMRRFGCDSYFRINDTTGFANAVSRHIPGFTHGAEGMCVHEEDPGILRDVEMGWTMTQEEVNGQLTYDPGDLQRIRDYLQQAAGLLPVFLKKAVFAEQAEYRMVWFTPAMADGFLTITVPEARQFCTPPPGVEVVPVETPEQVLAKREMTVEEFESQLEPGTFQKVVPRERD